MDQILYQYKLNLTTWMYLSSLLTIAIYFKFSRLWSLRNLDLLGLIALAPGLLLVSLQGQANQIGYIWLFGTGAFFLVRLLLDPMLVRRPLLEPNLTAGGLTFIAVSLMAFMLVNVLTKDPQESDLDGPRRLRALMARRESSTDTSLSKLGPGYAPMHFLPSISMRALMPADPQLSEESGRYKADLATARTMAILSHLAVVLGIVLIGVRHYDNIRTGIAAATLYLLLPYTAEMTGRIDHVLPAALLVWTVVAYRRPLIAGMLLGLCTGVIYYPVFLLPLWCGFYWQRGLLRFLLGFFVMLAALVASLAFISQDMNSFLMQVKMMLGWTSFSLDSGAQGFWAMSDSIGPYRIPVLVAFMVMSAGFALWPAQKNLGTLLSCSAAVMLGTQFWHAQSGGLYMGWYLPLLLLTVFRPNLEDRVAVTALGEGWWGRRRFQVSHHQAA
ncbi:MAG TPA: hypothetical protein VHV55_11590 [Pirellulales bacterium]|jgi:hypothetical protein|nr:hypothetical protein [Pirellulales bacterium]